MSFHPGSYRSVKSSNSSSLPAGLVLPSLPGHSGESVGELLEGSHVAAFAGPNSARLSISKSKGPLYGVCSILRIFCIFLSLCYFSWNVCVALFSSFANRYAAW